jgi:hypothetical protein
MESEGLLEQKSREKKACTSSRRSISKKEIGNCEKAEEGSAADGEQHDRKSSLLVAFSWLYRSLSFVVL